jgi:hypothetical protein
MYAINANGWLVNKQEEDYVNDRESYIWNGAGLWHLDAEKLGCIAGRPFGDAFEIQTL